MTQCRSDRYDKGDLHVTEQLIRPFFLAYSAARSRGGRGGVANRGARGGIGRVEGNLVWTKNPTTF